MAKGRHVYKPSWGKVPADNIGFTSVYVITADRVVKIGVSANPAKRASDIQTSQHCEVRVWWAIKVREDQAFAVERATHRILSHYHTRGEWFMASPETAREAIGMAIAEMGMEWLPDPNFGRLGAGLQPVVRKRIRDYYRLAYR